MVVGVGRKLPTRLLADVHLVHRVEDPAGFERRGFREAVGEQAPLEVVKLVLDNAGKESVEIETNLLPLERPGLNHHLLRPADVHPQAGQTQASLLLERRSARPGEGRIDEHELLSGVGVGLEVDDEQPVGEANLIGRQADPDRVVHDLEHLIDGVAEGVVDPHQRAGAPQEGRVGIFDELDPADAGRIGGGGRAFHDRLCGNSGGGWGGAFYRTALLPVRRTGRERGRRLEPGRIGIATATAPPANTFPGPFPMTSPPPARAPGAANAAERVPWSQPAVVLATCGWLGRIPRAPGTFGAALGIGLSAAAASLECPIGVEAAVAVLLCVVGIPICGLAARQMGRGSDPGAIVWDEMASVPLGLLLVPAGERSPPLLLAAFLLHRLFDIWKPFPCRQLDQGHGGLGIMADDWGAAAWMALGLAVGRQAGWW